MRKPHHSERCLVLARAFDDAFALVRAPQSDFMMSLHLPLPEPTGAYVLPCSGYHGYGSTINAQVGGLTTTIGWRLRSGDPARKLVTILIDSSDPSAVVTAARKTFTPATHIDYPVPPPDETPTVAPIHGEEPIPRMASQPLTSGPWRRTVFELVKEEARNGDVAPAFLLALVHEESRFNPHAVSSAGAIGLGQLMPATAEDRGVRDPFDPVQNLRGTIAQLKYLAGRINATPEPLVGGATGASMLLASYRSGLGNVRTRGISPNDWKYISRVEMHWRMYQKILHDALIHEDPIGTALILKVP